MDRARIDHAPLRPGCTGWWEDIKGRTTKSYLRHTKPCPIHCH